MSVFIPSMVLLRRMEAVRFVALWGVGAGFISVVNMSLSHNPAFSYVYFHYLFMHFYIFAVPIYLVIRGDIRIDYPTLLRSTGGLLVLSMAIFGLDVLIDANYMYIGPNSELAIPFLPLAWTRWPLSYPAFTGVCLVMFHVIYVLLRRLAPAESRA